MEIDVLIPAIINSVAILVLIIFSIAQYLQMNKQLEQQNEQLRLQNEQTRLNFFAEYTKRYQEIMWQLPSDIFNDDFDLKKLANEEQEKIKKNILIYFDLCSEEFYLHENEKIDHDVWKEWEEGIKFNMRKPAFNEIWKEKCLNSSFYTEFKKYINKKLNIKVQT